MLLGMKNLSQEQAYQQMRTMLNEKQWRQYLAVEAKQRGSPSLGTREARVSVKTVKRGLAELETGESYQPGQRVRKKGEARKSWWRPMPRCWLIWSKNWSPKEIR